MTVYKNKYIAYLLGAFVVFVFVLKGAFLIDPDFGWRLKTGELIASKGIPLKDPFSYTMPSFQFIDHAWLTDVLMYAGFNNFGKVALSFVFALLAISSVLIFSKSIYSKSIVFRSINPMHNPFIILSLAVILPYSGIRPQVLSWFFIAILLKILLNKKIWERHKFLLPFIFLVWVNLHGSFALGLTVVFVAVFFRWAREKRIIGKDFVVLGLSVVFTCINPYGLKIFNEIWLTVSDVNLRWRIVEWMSVLLFFNFAFTAYFSSAIILIWRYRSKFLLEEKILFLLFLTLALSSSRNVPLFVIFAYPIIFIGISYFFKEITNIKFAAQKFKSIYIFIWIGSIIIFITQAVISLDSSFQMDENHFYPKDALVFLKGNPSKGRIFSLYGWGGYMIWKMPEEKVYIDGRMPSWRWRKNLEGESNFAMEDYLRVLSKEGFFREEFEKYSIRTALLPATPKPEGAKFLQEKLISNVMSFLSIREDTYTLVEELEKDGWEKVYQDGVSVIYRDTEEL